MTKSVRTVTFKDLYKFLAIYKNNTNTNYGQPNLSMDKHSQATPQQPPTNYSEMLHQYNDSNSRPTSRCSTQSFASNELEAGESSPPVLSSSSTRNLVTQKAVQRGRKCVRYERYWSSEETAQLFGLWFRNPFYIALRYQNTRTKIRKAKQ